MAALSPLTFFASDNPGWSFVSRGTLAWFLAHFMALVFPVASLLSGWRGHQIHIARWAGTPPRPASTRILPLVREGVGRVEIPGLCVR